MKKLLILTSVFILFFSSCSMSNEEKAEKLISESLKNTLYHPDSYKPISTIVDSVYFNFEKLDKVFNSCAELNDLIAKQSTYQDKLYTTETVLGIYTKTPDHPEYKRYKKEYDDYKEKLGKVSKKINITIQELKNNAKDIHSKEFTGWYVIHSFSSQNYDNTSNIPKRMVFFCDKDFSNCGAGIDYDAFIQLMEFITNIPHFDSDNDLLDQFSDPI